MNTISTGSTFIHPAYACASGRIWPSRAPLFFLTSQAHLVRQLRYDDRQRTTFPQPRHPLYSLETVFFEYVCVTYFGGMRSIRKHPSFRASILAFHSFSFSATISPGARTPANVSLSLSRERTLDALGRSDGQGSSPYSLTEPLLAL